MRIVDCLFSDNPVNPVLQYTGQSQMSNHRDLYRIYENELIIDVIKLGSRGDVYK